MKIILVRKKKQILNFETFIANNYKKRFLETDLKKKWSQIDHATNHDCTDWLWLNAYQYVY